MAVDSGAVAAVLPVGAPCWVELSTGDEQRALEFYAALFGWEYSLVADSTVVTGRYAFATRDGFAVAGIFQTDRPVGWLPHVAVEDTATGAERVRLLGGEVTLGPIVLPRYDSIVYAQDPTGAPVALRCPPAGWVFTLGSAGTFASADLNTRDGDAADDFYCRMFGYARVRIGDAREIDYAEWQLGGKPVLHRYVMGSEHPPNTPSHWMVYFVADPLEGTDAITVRALALGGRIVVPPHDSQLGRAVVLADSSGAMFGVIDYSDSELHRRPAVEDPYDD